MTAEHTTGRRGRRALAAMTALGTAGCAVLAGAGPASAQPVSQALRYTCDVPMLGDEPFTARIDADIPESVAVGEPSRAFPITARTTVDGDLTPWLDRLEVTSVEGTVRARIGVRAPQGERQVTVPLHVARTGVPESGPFDVAAHGTAPSLTFSAPGGARIAVGAIDLHVIGRKANGEVRGELDVPCTLDGGQSGVVGTFQVTGAAPGPTTPAQPGATAPGTPPVPAPTDGKPSPTASPTGSLATTGHSSGGLLLPAAGALAAGIAAVALGARWKRHRRAADGR